MTNIVVSEVPMLHPVHHYLASLNQNSRVTMERGLKRVCDVLWHHEDVYAVPWEMVNADLMVMVRATLEKTYKPSTANNYLSALRGLLKHLWESHLIDTDTYTRIKNIKNIKFHLEPAGRVLKRAEVRQLLNACSDGVIGKRDTAVIATLYMLGIRRDELSHLKMSDYNDGVMRIMGKGLKQRDVHVSPQTADIVGDWLDLRGDSPGYLFCKMGKGGKILTMERFTPFAVHAMIKRRVHEAGVDDLSSHDFRRTLITELLERGVDAITVANIAGHSSTNTTRRYDRRESKAQKDAMLLMDLPL